MEGGIELKKMAVSYYEDLFTSDANTRGELIRGEFPLLDEGVNCNLRKECTEEEVVKALRSMESYKAPGPNGYQAIFLRDFGM